MKMFKYIMLAVVGMGFCVCLHSGALTNQAFSASMSNCNFTYSNPLNGSYTADITNGIGQMSSVSSASGSFSSIDNLNGTVYVLTTSTANGTNRIFTIKTNHIVNFNTGAIAATTANAVSPAPTTYTAVTLKITRNPNKGTYTSKTAQSSGSTNASDLNSTLMSINGVFK